jgi:ketopantoate reductase
MTVMAASNELMVTLGTPADALGADEDAAAVAVPVATAVVAVAVAGGVVADEPEQPVTMTATEKTDIASFLVSKTDSSF